MFRTPYINPPLRVTLDTGDESLVEQHHKDDCDITKILKKYDKTGLITHVNQMRADYGDFTNLNEYQESLNLVIKAQNSFNELPSSLRKKFNNDPGQFMEFVSNPDNFPEMISLGLANPREEVKPLLVKMVEEAVKPIS